MTRDEAKTIGHVLIFLFLIGMVIVACYMLDTTRYYFTAGALGIFGMIGLVRLGRTNR